MSKKITFNMIAGDMADETVSKVKYTGEHSEFEIEVKNKLGFKDAMKFVRDIAASCVDPESGSYNPEGFDFAMRVNTLVYYAGFAAPKDVAKAYQVVYGTEIYGAIVGAIDSYQHQILMDAAADRVEYAKELMVSAQATGVNDLIAKMDDVIQNGNETISELKGDEVKRMIDELSELSGKIEQAAAAQEEAGIASDNIVVLPIEGE